MKWKGTVVQLVRCQSTRTFAAQNAPRPTSCQYLRTNEAISDTTHRFDRSCSHLGPQPGHVHVNHVRAGVEGVAPDPLQQLVARADFGRVSHQMLEQQELPGREAAPANAGVDNAPAEVELNRAHPQGALRL